MAQDRGWYGPYLRFGNYDPDTHDWTGSVLIVAQAPLFRDPPILALSGESVNDEVMGVCIYTHKYWRFWRFDFKLSLLSVERKVDYCVKPKKGKPIESWSFYTPAIDQNWHWSTHSCSGFSSTIDPEDWGGVAPLWKDMLRKHDEKPFHAVVGGGDQIYCDSVFKIPELSEWMQILHDGKDGSSAPFSDKMDQACTDYIFKLYCEHFDNDGMKQALASIPQVMIWDDHDIFDGWGSYPEDLQTCPVFQGLFAVLRLFYLLFQHHATYEMTQMPDSDLFGTGLSFSFLKYFGPTVALLGVDIRAERTKTQVLSEETWDVVFRKLEEMPRTVKHLVIEFTVPIIYPHVPMTESVLSALGLANQWNVVHQLLNKTGLASSLLKFNEPELLDDLWDHWTSTGHHKERSEFVLRLQKFVIPRGIRVTFISGDVHAAAVGRFKTRGMDCCELAKDPRFMPQIITSAIVNAPPPEPIIRLVHMFDAAKHDVDWRTEEEMVKLFALDPTFKEEKVLGRRNWCEVIEAEWECDGGLKFILWVEDPERIGVNLTPYHVLVPTLTPGYEEATEEEILSDMDNFWTGPWSAGPEDGQRSFKLNVN